MRVLGPAAFVAAMLFSPAGMAADVRVLGVGVVQSAVEGLAADFARESGHRIVFTVGSPAAVTQRIAASEVFDAVIVSEPAMDRLDRDGIVNPESRVPLAKAGIALRAGAPGPDLSTPEAPTTYEGALMSDGAVPEAARAFIRFLAEPEARARWLAAGLEPPADH